MPPIVCQRYHVYVASAPINDRKPFTRFDEAFPDLIQRLVHSGKVEGIGWTYWEQNPLATDQVFIDRSSQSHLSGRSNRMF